MACCLRIRSEDEHHGRLTVANVLTLVTAPRSSSVAGASSKAAVLYSSARADKFPGQCMRTSEMGMASFRDIWSRATAARIGIKCIPTSNGFELSYRRMAHSSPSIAATHSPNAATSTALSAACRCCAFVRRTTRRATSPPMMAASRAPRTPSAAATTAPIPPLQNPSQVPHEIHANSPHTSMSTDGVYL